MNGQYQQFNQDEILDMVKSYTIDEDLYEFGDVIVNSFDSYTGLPDEDGMLVNFHVCGFCDGEPLFTGIMRSDVDREEAISFTINHIKERILRTSIAQALGFEFPE